MCYGEKLKSPSEESEREQNCVYVRQKRQRKKNGSEEDMRKKIRKTHGNVNVYVNGNDYIQEKKIFFKLF